jgi:cobalt/nickel transport system permease protein
MHAGIPWAVHIADGALTLPWLLGGFAVAAVLAAWSAWQVRDEEIPRIALLSAAFFVASLLHLRVPPTSVHLLLNSLVGVVLGRRAPLAIAVGLFLQAALLGHGGFTTLGVNACVLTIPALLAGWSFHALHRGHWLQDDAARLVLTAAGTAVASLGLVFLVALIATNHGGRLLALDPDPAWRAATHPVPLAVAAALGVLASWALWRSGAPAEFVLGFVTGAVAVLATVALNALVLLLGGLADWHTVVTIVVVAHLPLALVEGMVVGYTVALLARVKPELLGILAERPTPAAVPLGQPVQLPDDAVALRPPALLLAVLSLALAAGPARAHRLLADCRMISPGKVEVEGYFDITGDPPQGARVLVYEDKRVVAEGRTDEKGRFVFSHSGSEPLRVVMEASAGHRAEILIPAGSLAPAADAVSPGTSASAPSVGGQSLPPTAFHQEGAGFKDVLLGVTFLLALAAFVLSVRNARRARAGE